MNETRPAWKLRKLSDTEITDIVTIVLVTASYVLSVKLRDGVCDRNPQYTQEVTNV